MDRWRERWISSMILVGEWGGWCWMGWDGMGCDGKKGGVCEIAPNGALFRLPAIEEKIEEYSSQPNRLSTTSPSPLPLSPPPKYHPNLPIPPSNLSNTVLGLKPSTYLSPHLSATLPTHACGFRRQSSHMASPNSVLMPNRGTAATTFSYSSRVSNSLNMGSSGPMRSAPMPMAVATTSGSLCRAMWMEACRAMASQTNCLRC